MGLISKHGILIVQFANELQAAGRTRLEAISEAAAIRLRPILMTTAAMVLGVFPLVIASGAGAAGRQAMGWVIFAGLSIGTLFTLLLSPTWKAKYFPCTMVSALCGTITVLSLAPSTSCTWQ